MTAGHESKSHMGNETESRQKAAMSTHVVQANLGRFCGEIVAILGVMFICILVARDAKLDGNSVSLMMSRVTLVAASCFFATQLSAIIRLVQFRGACVMDRKGFKHFYMGTLHWRTIRDASLMEVVRGGEHGSVHIFLVLSLDRKTLNAIKPHWVRRLVVRRYARFNVENSSIELSCDFLKIQPDSLMWQVLLRTDFGVQRHAS